MTPELITTVAVLSLLGTYALFHGNKTMNKEDDEDEIVIHLNSPIKTNPDDLLQYLNQKQSKRLYPKGYVYFEQDNANDTNSLEDEYDKMLRDLQKGGKKTKKARRKTSKRLKTMRKAKRNKKHLSSKRKR